MVDGKFRRGFPGRVSGEMYSPDQAIGEIRTVNRVVGEFTVEGE